eukprot:TRINITY_DN923_c0_g1_i1.p4 TRINITY_DN923_c0_g1~~TRINITY_DN923_c0_g1_i1.p4  ORF type:complete len:294 (-),score=43.85 TRINITY_DN923_c0_g1_i1:7892-8773(-)
MSSIFRTDLVPVADSEQHPVGADGKPLNIGSTFAGYAQHLLTMTQFFSQQQNFMKDWSANANPKKGTMLWHKLAVGQKEMINRAMWIMSAIEWIFKFVICIFSILYMTMYTIPYWGVNGFLYSYVVLASLNLARFVMFFAFIGFDSSKDHPSVFTKNMKYFLTRLAWDIIIMCLWVFFKNFWTGMATGSSALLYPGDQNYMFDFGHYKTQSLSDGVVWSSIAIGQYFIFSGLQIAQTMHEFMIMMELLASLIIPEINSIFHACETYVFHHEKAKAEKFGHLVSALKPVPGRKS